MKKMKVFAIFLSLALLITSFSGSVFAFDDELENKEDSCPIIDSPIFYIKCIDNNQVIYNVQGNIKTPPTGLVSVCAAMVIINATDDFEKVIAVPSDIQSALSGSGAATLGLKAGERYKISDLLSVMLVRSYADVVYTLISATVGSSADFVKAMNDYALSLGCKNTVFTNFTGLDDDGQYTTAEDTATIAAAATLNGDYIRFGGKTSYALSSEDGKTVFNVSSSNLMLYPVNSSYFSKYIKWGKYSYTSGGGECVVTQVTEGGCKYIFVCMGGREDSTRNYALRDSFRMIQWIIKYWSYKTLCEAGQYIGDIEVRHCVDMDSVSLVAAASVKQITKKCENAETVLIKIDPGKTPEAITKSAKKGDVVGWATIYFGNNDSGYSGVPLTVSKDVKVGIGGYVVSILRTCLPAIYALIALLVLYIILHIFIGFTIKFFPFAIIKKDRSVVNSYKIKYKYHKDNLAQTAENIEIAAENKASNIKIARSIKKKKKVQKKLDEQARRKALEEQKKRENEKPSDDDNDDGMPDFLKSAQKKQSYSDIIQSFSDDKKED